MHIRIGTPQVAEFQRHAAQEALSHVDKSPRLSSLNRLVPSLKLDLLQQNNGTLKTSDAGRESDKEPPSSSKGGGAVPASSEKAKEVILSYQ